MNKPGGVPWLFRVVSVVVSLLLGIGLLELGLRLFWLKRLTLDAGIEDPHFHHRLKPSETYHYYSSEFDVHIRTNRFGLRGPDPVLPKPPGLFRILMLGDSFTFGFPVQDQETFSYLIERGLQAHGYPVEVVNGGISGYSPVLEYIALRDEFIQFDPDLVILWYDRGDLQDDALYERNLLYDPHGNILRCDPHYVNGQFDWWDWCQAHSAIAKYLQTRIIRTVQKMQLLGVGGYLRVILHGERAKVAIARLKTEQQASDLPMYDRFLMIRETTTPALLERYWPISGRYVLMIRDLLAQRGIPFILGTYPYGVTAGATQWAEGRVYWGFERSRLYDSSAVRTVVMRFAQTEGIPLIRTAPSFRAAAQSEKLYYNWDGHMTAAGHRVLAEHVLQDAPFLTLVEQGLLRRQLLRGTAHRGGDKSHGS